jgi:PPM family protein phosphatase
MRFDLASFTHPVGCSSNEDRLALFQHRRLIAGIVADGASGHGGGNVAAQLVVDTVSDVLRDCALSDTRVETAQLADALLAANRAIVDAQAAGGALARMRSTAAILAIDPRAAHASWAYCGDSRIYCFREGRTVLKTLDHGVARQLVDGKPHAALGTEDALEVEAARTPFEIADRDVFLVCSDGFWKHLDEAAMIGAIGESDDAAGWLAALADRARDDGNLSAIAVWAR